MAGDLFNTRFAYYHFNEKIFPCLGRVKTNPSKKEEELTWNAMHLNMYDLETNASEQEVKKLFIINI